MQTGQLDKLITIRGYTVTTLASGQEQKTFADVTIVFGNVRYITGNEAYQADQKVATRKLIVTIYNRIVTITEKNQLVIDSVNYAILSITPIENEFYLELEVENRDNNNVI